MKIRYGTRYRFFLLLTFFMYKWSRYMKIDWLALQLNCFAKWRMMHIVYVFLLTSGMPLGRQINVRSGLYFNIFWEYEFKSPYVKPNGMSASGCCLY